MPPRIVIAFIVAFWLGTTGWFAYREWWSWWRLDSPPPFTVELADEAAPLTAQWSIWRNERRTGDRKIGSAMTRMRCLKDDSFELYSSIENLDLWSSEDGKSSMKVTRLTTVQRVTRDGQLIAINSSLELAATHQGQSFDVKAGLEGTAKEGKLYARGRLESLSFGKFEEQLDPIPLESGSIMNPLQPVAKLQVRPGQRWRIRNVDPLEQAVFAAAKRSLLGKLINERLLATSPKVLSAEVLDKPYDLAHRGDSISCYVIEFRSGDIAGRTFVQVRDGKVLRQEASMLGQTLVLLRED